MKVGTASYRLGRERPQDCPFVNAGHGLLSAQRRVRRMQRGIESVRQRVRGRPTHRNLEVPPAVSSWFRHPFFEWRHSNDDESNSDSLSRETNLEILGPLQRLPAGYAWVRRLIPWLACARYVL